MSAYTHPVPRASRRLSPPRRGSPRCGVAFLVPYLGVSVLDLSTTSTTSSTSPSRSPSSRPTFGSSRSTWPRSSGAAGAGASVWASSSGSSSSSTSRHGGRDRAAARRLLRLRAALARRRLRPDRHAAADDLSLLRRLQAPARARRRAEGEGAVHRADAAAGAHHHRDLPLGYPQYREDGLSRPETGNVLISIPTFATANPVGSVVAHVSQHIAAVTHAYESRIFNPPVTKS